MADAVIYIENVAQYDIQSEARHIVSEQKILQLESDVSKLFSLNSRLLMIIQELQNKLDQHTELISDLNNKLSDTKNTLQNVNNQLSGTISLIQTEFVQISESIGNLNTEVADTKNNLQTLTLRFNILVNY